MSKGGQIQPGGGGPRGDFGDPAYDAGNNGLMLGGLPPSLYNGLNQMPTTYDYFGPAMPQYDFGPAMPYGSPYAPTPMMSQPGAINDPTVNAALAVLNRSQPGNQMPGLMPMMMPAMRGSGVSDQVRQYNFGLVPKTPYQTATYSTPAAPVDSGAGSDSGGMDVGVDNGFSSLSPSDRAAYYAENPTMGSIGRVVNSAVENSLPGAAIGYFDPGAFTTNDAIMAGMDPTGWQFAERESDGIFGTQIGGTLSFPELTPENFGPYAFPETNAPTVGNYVADAPVASPVSSPVGIDAFGGAGPDVGSVGIDAFGGAGPDVGSVGIDAFGGAGPSVDTGSVGIDAFGGYGSDVGSVGIDAFGGSGPDVGSVGIDAFGGAGPDVGSVGIDAFGGSGPSVDTGSAGIDAFGGSGPDAAALTLTRLMRRLWLQQRRGWRRLSGVVAATEIKLSAPR
jgi:hypothetical protein